MCIRDRDISVSRLHAMINYDNGDFFIEDNGSKFGTLYLCQGGVRLGPNAGETTVQVGRSVLTLSIERQVRRMSLGACFGQISVERDEAPPGQSRRRMLESSLGRSGTSVLAELANRARQGSQPPPLVVRILSDERIQVAGPLPIPAPVDEIIADGQP
eukprot:TRINITY_DN5400_c0_g1_i1.p1 TRINITY_DN5400_c0_g1~~TRINITY_DN5400_c0_g1_i1.p1  ORF type:complete len:158 (-),score=27.61 TRINITY_DN5400_c0_g1_i1:34-507(-)